MCATFNIMLPPSMLCIYTHRTWHSLYILTDFTCVYICLPLAFPSSFFLSSGGLYMPSAVCLCTCVLFLVGLPALTVLLLLPLSLPLVGGDIFPHVSSPPLCYIYLSPNFNCYTFSPNMPYLLFLLHLCFHVLSILTFGCTLLLCVFLLHLWTWDTLLCAKLALMWRLEREETNPHSGGGMKEKKRRREKKEKKEKKKKKEKEGMLLTGW